MSSLYACTGSRQIWPIAISALCGNAPLRLADRWQANGVQADQSPCACFSPTNWKLHALAVHPQCHMASDHSPWYDLSIDGKHHCRKQRPLTRAILAIPLYCHSIVSARNIYIFLPSLSEEEASFAQLADFIAHLTHHRRAVLSIMSGWLHIAT